MNLAGRLGIPMFVLATSVIAATAVAQDRPNEAELFRAGPSDNKDPIEPAQPPNEQSPDTTKSPPTARSPETTALSVPATTKGKCRRAERGSYA